MVTEYYRQLFDERELSELDFAKVYAEAFHHGTDGHHRLMLLAKLEKMLDVLVDSDEKVKELKEKLNLA